MPISFLLFDFSASSSSPTPTPLRPAGWSRKLRAAEVMTLAVDFHKTIANASRALLRVRV